jgi:hypothetical protein
MLVAPAPGVNRLHLRKLTRSERRRGASNRSRIRVSNHAWKNCSGYLLRRPLRFRWRDRSPRAGRRPSTRFLSAAVGTRARPLARNRQGAFHGTVRPLPRRARRQAAQDRHALEPAWAFQRADCPSRERPPTGQDRRRATRGNTVHFELVEGQRFRRKGTTKALVTRMPARAVLRPLVHPSELRTRRRSGVNPQIQNLDPDSARDEQAREGHRGRPTHRGGVKGMGCDKANSRLAIGQLPRVGKSEVIRRIRSARITSGLCASGNNR